MNIDTWQQDIIQGVFGRCYGLAKVITEAEVGSLSEKGCKDEMARQTGFRLKYIEKNWDDIVTLAKQFTAKN
jgi:hypothetical protein